MSVRRSTILVSALLVAAIAWAMPRSDSAQAPQAAASSSAAYRAQFTTAGQSLGAAAAQPQASPCPGHAPVTPVGMFDLASIPDNGRTDMRAAPLSSILFDRTVLRTNMVYSYGDAVGDFNCDGRWDVSFFDSWAQTTARPKGAIGYISYSGNPPTQIVPLDTWPELGRENNGLNLFERHVPLDINGDGWPDIVGIANSHGAAIAYLNPGPNAPPGTAWTRRYLSTTVPGPVNLAARDIDGDGLTDLVIAMRVQPSSDPNPEIRGLVWLKNPGPSNTGLWARHTIGPSSDLVDPRNLQIADFDRDGRLDVFIGDTATGIVSTFLQIAPDQWERHDVFVTAIHGHFGTTVDEDNDGVPEIIQPRYLGIDLLKFDPANKTWVPHHLVAYTPESTLIITGDITVGDMDGDGYSDIVFSLMGLTTSKTAPRRGGIFMMRHSQHWKVETIVQTTYSVVQVNLADMNRDGLPDIVADAEYPLNSVAIYYQRRTPRWF